MPCILPNLRRQGRANFGRIRIMSKHDFDKAVNFLQGALDLAAAEAARPEPTTEVRKTSPAVEATMPLPGFEEIAAPTPPPAETNVILTAPPAPTPAPAAPTARPTADEPSESAPSVPTPATARKVPNRLVAALLIAAAFGIGLAGGLRLISPRIETQEVVREIEVPGEPDGVPLALLPDTADAALWDIVSEMSGTIDGENVRFHRGLAETEDGDYRLCLDFCRSGRDLYARISGRRELVVRLTEEGRIIRTYGAPANKRPLKDLFAR